MVKIVEESIYYILGTEDYHGNACFLKKNGTYVKTHYNNAQEMSEEEMKQARELLNKRLPRPARIREYIV